MKVLPPQHGRCHNLERDQTNLSQRIADIEHTVEEGACDTDQQYVMQSQKHAPEQSQTSMNLQANICTHHQCEVMEHQSCVLLETFFSETDNLAIACLDTQFNFLRVNHTYAIKKGYDPAFFIGKNLFTLYPSHDHQNIFEYVVEDGKPYIEYARPCHEHPCPESEKRYCDWIMHPVKDADGRIEGILMYLIDATERVRTEEIYRTLVDHSPQGLVIFQHQRIVFTNRSMAAITGYTIEEMVAMVPEQVQALIHGEDRAVVQGYFNDCLQGKPLPPRYEHRLIRKDGEIRWIEATLAAIRYRKQPALQGAFIDITERRSAEEQLRQRVLHDDLTGLPNRTLFMEFLEHAIKRARRDAEYQFAVLFLDLNNFKVINDSLGHLAGDKMLITIAGRLKARVRASDTVARFGGDEFVILIESISNVLEVIVLTHRIQRDIAWPIYLNNHEVLPSVSIGIALGSSDYDHPADILRDADTAMYSSRALGPGRYAVFDGTMHTQVMRRLNMEGALRRAIECDELCLYYQPIVSFATGHIVGFEALVRWKHPQRGILSPGEFIPIAEETNLIIPLNWFVIRQACRQVRDWQAQFPNIQHITIAVNLSAQAFTYHSMVDQIGQVLRETNLDPPSLKIEITENIMMDHAEATITTLKRLCDMGIHLCIDDFGTGFSSLRYLHRFPIKILKVDRSFVGNLNVDTESAAIIQNIITLSHTLGKEVIAEGVETAEQLRYLKHLGCEYGQGFLFARPVNSKAAEKLLARGSYDIAQLQK